jgi:hypothetical protein
MVLKHLSYQVPKEVGRVGKESENFIKPVSQRKDGIEAMFSNYRKNSPTKRKRTPQTPTVIDAGESSVTADETPSKRPRTNSVEIIEVRSINVCPQTAYAFINTFQAAT